MFIADKNRVAESVADVRQGEIAKRLAILVHGSAKSAVVNVTVTVAAIAVIGAGASGVVAQRSRNERPQRWTDVVVLIARDAVAGRTLCCAPRRTKVGRHRRQSGNIGLVIVDFGDVPLSI